MTHVTPVRSEPVAETIRRLERFIARMEARYECSSEEMEQLVAAGRLRETREVGKWLTEVRMLRALREAAGAAAG